MSRALAVPLFALALSACLVPQSVDPNTTRPHTVPTIDLNALFSYMYSPEVQVYLPGPTDTSSSPQCRCVLHLEIPFVKDEDPTVNLEARWFVDYDLNGSAQSQTQISTQVLGGSFTDPSLTRGPVVFNFDPVLLNITKDDTVHVIEMVIAEQQGFAADALGQPPLHRALLPGWDGSTLKIVARVHVSSAGRCDRNPAVISPPLQRINSNNEPCP
jgi:hypothetical protein